MTFKPVSQLKIHLKVDASTGSATGFSTSPVTELVEVNT